MRIVVSGTHGSGKSTLISDFAVRHPEYTVLTDLFDIADETASARDPALHATQLRLAADRLTIEERADDVIAERGPVDFLAYLVAVAELTGRPLDAALLGAAMARTAGALRRVDLLVVLPLTSRDPIHVAPDEYLELRDAVNDVLLDLIDDEDVVGERLTVVEVTGTPAQRLAAVEREVRSAGR